MADVSNPSLSSTYLTNAQNSIDTVNPYAAGPANTASYNSASASNATAGTAGSQGYSASDATANTYTAKGTDVTGYSADKLGNANSYNARPEARGTYAPVDESDYSGAADVTWTVSSGLCVAFE